MMSESALIGEIGVEINDRKMGNCIVFSQFAIVRLDEEFTIN